MTKNKISNSIISIGFVSLYLVIFLINSKVVDMFFKMASIDKVNGTVGTLVNVYLKLILLTAIPMIIYYVILRIRKINIRDFCKFKRISLRNFISCIALGISISVFIILFMKIPYVEKNMPALENFFSGFDQGSILTYLLFTFIIYTITEEVLFRGLIFNELNKVFAVSVSVIIQALLFIFMQSDIVTIIFGISSYFIYCLAYIRTDSIWGSITILYTSHSFVMLTRRSGITDRLANTDLIPLAAGAGISIIITVFILYYLFRISRETKFEIKPVLLNRVL